MATLVLGALGTLIGGPVGGLIGALAGRQVDGAVLGAGRREGPRLKDLAISTSSYGQQLPRVFGRARVAGSIIWATDLVERKTRSGGGKGKPSVTSFSYTTSFAVALSSRPIRSVGRVWADGQLLRGTAGDLKAGGSMRVHTGHGDQTVDPLLAAANGAQCPAFRGCAYVVFEDLQLADYGNRIPALSFEVIADDGPLDLSALVDPLHGAIEAARPLPGLIGFEQPAGPVAQTLELIDMLYPLQIGSRGDTLTLAPPADLGGAPIALPPPAASEEDGGFSPQTGGTLVAASGGDTVVSALRYYEAERDYQPGVQRREGGQTATGQPAHSAAAEYPAVFTASTARSLLRAAWVRASGRGLVMKYRIASLDPAVRPGALVTVPGENGQWRVLEWEWSAHGVELVLRRVRPQSAIAAPADPGETVPPLDDQTGPTWLRAFELPLDDPSLPGQTRRFLAASSAAPGWRGAELMGVSGASLKPLGASGRQRSIGGLLTLAVPPSPALQIEAQAVMSVELIGADMALSPTDRAGLAAGANRLLVGSEIVQFLDAVPLGGRTWQLRGLLRGRGGSEPAALAGHPAGTGVTLLDGPLVPLDSLEPEAGAARDFAALGLADSEPVVAPLQGEGASARPPCRVIRARGSPRKARSNCAGPGAHAVRGGGTTGSMCRWWSRPSAISSALARSIALPGCGRPRHRRSPCKPPIWRRYRPAPACGCASKAPARAHPRSCSIFADSPLARLYRRSR